MDGRRSCEKECTMPNEKRRPMNGKGRTILLYCGSIMLILAMVMPLATVSQAQQRGDEAGVKLHQRLDEAGAKLYHSKPVKKVPELSTSALLILGIGLTGLAGYCLRRRKRGA